MPKKTIMKLLPDVFVPRDNGEGVCFASDFMDREQKEKYTIYGAISNAIRDSGLSFDFSYEVAHKAVTILIDLEDWNNDDLITEAIDSAIPVYNTELMQIYLNDWEAVDEATTNYGVANDGDSITRAISGWHYAISNMVNEIKSNLEALIQ